MKLIRNIVILVFMFIATMELGRAQSVTYECTYKHGLEKEVIGTTTLKTKIIAKKIFNNLKYTFVLSNTSNFNELDDYVTIENDKGHRITYALSCK